jgi:hypothetical protein
MMDNKKILIMNLSKGLIGETNANLLGSMLTTRIYLAAMSRANLPVEQMKKMPNFYFYVDEFQSFANATFANILSEARKYHLNLIIAHQYIAQMEEEVRDAVFGNVGTTVTFRVGPFDAEVLETVFTPTFLAADLVNLGFAQIYLTLMIDGVGSQPFSAATLPPIHRPPVSCRDMVINSSRTQYANRRELIEKLVTDLHTPTPPPEKAKKPEMKKPTPVVTQAPFETRTPRKVDTAKPTEVRSPHVSERKPEVSKMQTAPVKSPDDLRSILSKMSQTHPKSTESGYTEGAHPSGQKVAETGKPKETGREAPAKNDLKNALASIMKLQSTEVSTPEKITQPKPTERIVPPAQPASLTHQRRAAPSFAPAPDNTIDESVVKRMLREEKQDRSPFA